MTEASEPEDIELISGLKSILLIAPHGVETEPKDDENTAKLTRLISEQVKCSAIINTIYRKPTGDPLKRNNGQPSLKEKVLDLNIVEQAKQLPRFIPEIKKVVDIKTLTYVFWIHGIADDSIEKIDDTDIEKNIQCLIGYGQPETKRDKFSHLTAEDKTIDIILNQFKENKIKAIKAPETSNYCGWEKTNMNQWFRLKEYSLDKVQSIQLEFKMTGCRENDYLNETAEKVANAISFFANPVSICLPVDVEKDSVVEEVYQHLKTVFHKHFQKAMLEAGQHIIKSFYGNDYKRAQEKERTGAESLSQLIKRLKNDSNGDVPSRTWVYDAVNLAIDHELYKKGILPSAYGQVGHSHKVNLTYAPNLEVKQTLIEEIVEKKYTVIEVRKRIKEEKRKTDTEYISLKEKMPTDKLETFDIKKLIALKKQTLKLEEEGKKYLTIYQGNLERIEKVLGSKHESSYKQYSSKIISVSRRTDIPAFYSTWFFNRLKDGYVQVKVRVSNKNTVKVSLVPEDVMCFVFWTKNPGPMISRLNELKSYNYYFHFTLTPYDRGIEKKLPPKEKLVETFIELSQKIGKEKVIWRYDPILLNNKIDIEYHKKHFLDLSERLHNYTEKCVISFIDTKNISKKNKESLKLEKITDEKKMELGKEIQMIGEKYGLKIETCAAKKDFSEIGIYPAKCIDDGLIGRILGKKLSIAKDPSQRQACGCVKSTDIGTYNTCQHGCCFCYATEDEAKAEVYYQQHDKN